MPINNKVASFSKEIEKKILGRVDKEKVIFFFFLLLPKCTFTLKMEGPKPRCNVITAFHVNRSKLMSYLSQINHV